MTKKLNLPNRQTSNWSQGKFTLLQVSTWLAPLHKRIQQNFPQDFMLQAGYFASSKSKWSQSKIPNEATKGLFVKLHRHCPLLTTIDECSFTIVFCGFFSLAAISGPASISDSLLCNNNQARVGLDPSAILSQQSSFLPFPLIVRLGICKTESSTLTQGKTSNSG